MILKKARFKALCAPPGRLSSTWLAIDICKVNVAIRLISKGYKISQPDYEAAERRTNLAVTSGRLHIEKNLSDVGPKGYCHPAH
jgi:hypothetical protein